jgi:hypothetical protein
MDILAHLPVRFIGLGHITGQAHESERCDNLIPLQNANLFYAELKQALVFHESFEVFPYHTFAYTGRRTGEDQVPDVERKIVGYVGNDGIKTEDHVPGVTLLDQFLVLVQAEVDVLAIQLGLDVDPLPDHGRIIPGFRLFPGQPFGLEVILDVTGGEINAHRYRIVIFVGVLLLDIFPVLGDPEYQFAFIMEFIGELGIVKRGV